MGNSDAEDSASSHEYENPEETKPKVKHEKRKKSSKVLLDGDIQIKVAENSPQRQDILNALGPKPGKSQVEEIIYGLMRDPAVPKEDVAKIFVEWVKPTVTMPGPGPIQMQITTPRFEKPEEMPWEEFEEAFRRTAETLGEDDKKRIFASALGAGPYQFYNTNPEFKTMSFDEIMEAFRRQYSKRKPPKEGPADLPQPIYMSRDETVLMFETRLRRAFMHVVPIPPRFTANMSEKTKKELQKEYDLAKHFAESMMINFFKQGVYREWAIRLEEKAKSIKSLSDAATYAKKWEATEKKYKR